MNLVPKGDPNGTAKERRDYDLNIKFENVSTFWGQMTIAVHGNENGVYQNGRKIMISDFVKMIKEHPRYEEAKKEANQKGRKMEIILLSCETGKTPESGAKPVGQQVADGLADEDVVVKAPDKYVLPARLDSIGPGYELSETGRISSKEPPALRRFKSFEYKNSQ